MIDLIIFSTVDGYVFFKSEEIICCECEDRKTVIYTINGKKRTVFSNMCETEEKLKDRDFFKCGRNMLVNLYHIAELTNEEGGMLVLCNGRKIEISRRARIKLGEILGL
jgi:two-component system LytT family response regulator